MYIVVWYWSMMVCCVLIRRPPRSTQSRSSAASNMYKRQYISTWSTSTMINLQHWRPLYRKSISGMECVLGQVASSLRTTTINLRAEIIYVTDFARYVTWVWSKMNNMWFSNAPFTTISGKINGGLIFLIRLWAEWIFLCLKGGRLRFMSSYFELSEDDSQFLIAPLGQYRRTKKKQKKSEMVFPNAWPFLPSTWPLNTLSLIHIRSCRTNNSL